MTVRLAVVVLSLGLRRDDLLDLRGGTDPLAAVVAPAGGGCVLDLNVVGVLWLPSSYQPIGGASLTW